MKAANAHFVSIEFNTYEYNYGAAHGTGASVYFGWWLKNGRALKTTDIFGANSDWKSFLAQQSFLKLKGGNKAEELFGDDQVRKAIPGIVVKPDNWAIDSNKLEIEFSVYSVGPYVAGDFTVDFTWDELRSYLAPGFDPAVLPKPIPSSAKQ